MIIRILLFCLLLSFSAHAKNFLLFSWENDSLIEKGFRDGIIREFPEARFYTFGCNRDEELMEQYLDYAVTIPDRFYLASSLEAIKAVRRKDPDAPKVFVMVQDPVEEGIVASRKQPSAKATGVSTKIPIQEQLNALRNITDFKTLGILKQLEDHDYLYSLSELERLSDFLGYHVVEIPYPYFGNVNERLEEYKPDVVYIPGSVRVSSEVLASIHAKGIPTISENASLVEKGVLLALVIDQYRAGRFAARLSTEVINGNPIEETPVLAIEHFMVALNIRTAERIGLNIPISLLIIADRIIR
ncbi:ABC transporter substrate-binding protein [Limisalsivibrio acetivorans]|uniref:ABC transporter substrate-binding protein n=1 Tax=Limisalsivibrio acetivorans TaxID=1304888 RepID=UPI0003B478A4|nr:ABC transporter substrate binding protein [Limisalsivibrio acetivorans]